MPVLSTVYAENRKEPYGIAYRIKEKENQCGVWNLHFPYGHVIFSVTVTLNIGRDYVPQYPILFVGYWHCNVCYLKIPLLEISFKELITIS